MVELPITAFQCAASPFILSLNIDTSGGAGLSLGRTTTGVPAFLTSTNGLIEGTPGFSGLMGSSSTTVAPAASTVVVTAGQSTSAGAAPTQLAGRVEMVAVGLLAVLNVL